LPATRRTRGISSSSRHNLFLQEPDIYIPDVFTVDSPVGIAGFENSRRANEGPYVYCAYHAYPLAFQGLGLALAHHRRRGRYRSRGKLARHDWEAKSMVTRRYQTSRMEEQKNDEQDKEVSLLGVKEIPDQS
jgi:hypothetical protein